MLTDAIVLPLDHHFVVLPLMTRSVSHQKSLERAIQQLQAMIVELGQVPNDVVPDEWLGVRAQLGVLNAEFNASIDEVDRSLHTTGARSESCATSRFT